MFKRQYLVSEFAFLLYMTIQAILPSEFTSTSSFTGFLILTVTAYFMEGLRPTIVGFFIAQCLTTTKNPYAQYASIVLAAFIIFYFPLYKMPTPSGRYNVGFSEIKINEIDVALFYPTNEKTKDVKNFPHEEYWERFYEVQCLFAKFFSKKNFLPKIIYKFTLSYLKHLKVGVNAHAQIIKCPDSNGFPVIIWSHGLSGNRYIYSFLLKEWASHGYLVLSLEHDELIFPKFSTYDEYISHRVPHILDRRKLGQASLDFLHDHKRITQLLGEDVKMNYQKILMAGHSLGAGTPVEVSLYDKRITGGIVLLDPWLDACDSKMYSTSVDVPILAIRSHEYEGISFVTEKVLNYMKGSNSNKNLNISGYFTGSKHNLFTDLVFQMPREMEIVGMVSKMGLAGPYLLVHNAMILSFVLTIKEQNVKKDSKDFKETVMKRFKELLDPKFDLQYNPDKLD